MKMISLSMLMVASLATFASIAAAGQSPEQMIAAAKDVDQRFCDAFGKGDVQAVMATYWNSPDLVFYPPDTMELRGWDAVKDNFTKFLAPGMKLELIDPHYQVAGNVVLGWGKWKLTMPGPDGKPAEMLGRYTSVMAEKNGKWVYIIDHPSVPMTPGEK